MCKKIVSLLMRGGGLGLTVVSQLVLNSYLKIKFPTRAETILMFTSHHTATKARTRLWRGRSFGSLIIFI